MLPELSEIKKRRKKFGFTQSGLAAKTGVSQSLIAKIESDSIVPSYTNAKRLFDFFESLHEQTQAQALEFMSSKVIGVSPQASIKEAVRVMKKHAVSQLPVIEDGRNIGTLSEKIVLEKMNNAQDLNEISSMEVRDVMTEAMPTIREDTQFKAISALLEHNPGVIVAKKGKVTGIITKSDLLDAVLEKTKKKAELNFGDEENWRILEINTRLNL